MITIIIESECNNLLLSKMALMQSENKNKMQRYKAEMKETKMKQTETVGKNFLANLAGPIILKTIDLNKE